MSRRGRGGALQKRYGKGRVFDLSTAVHAVDEPQHGDNLEAVHEHGGEYVTCKRCGRQWAIHGSHAELITEGDGYCDDNPEGGDY